MTPMKKATEAGWGEYHDQMRGGGKADMEKMAKATITAFLDGVLADEEAMERINKFVKDRLPYSPDPRQFAEHNRVLFEALKQEAGR